MTTLTPRVIVIPTMIEDYNDNDYDEILGPQMIIEDHNDNDYDEILGPHHASQVNELAAVLLA